MPKTYHCLRNEKLKILYYILQGVFMQKASTSTPTPPRNWLYDLGDILNGNGIETKENFVTRITTVITAVLEKGKERVASKQLKDTEKRNILIDKAYTFISTQTKKEKKKHKVNDQFSSLNILQTKLFKKLAKHPPLTTKQHQLHLVLLKATDKQLANMGIPLEAKNHKFAHTNVNEWFKHFNLVILEPTNAHIQEKFLQSVKNDPETEKKVSEERDVLQRTIFANIREGKMDRSDLQEIADFIKGGMDILPANQAIEHLCLNYKKLIVNINEKYREKLIKAVVNGLETFKNDPMVPEKKSQEVKLELNNNNNNINNEVKNHSSPTLTHSRTHSSEHFGGKGSTPVTAPQDRPDNKVRYNTPESKSEEPVATIQSQSDILVTETPIEHEPVVSGKSFDETKGNEEYESRDIGVIVVNLNPSTSSDVTEEIPTSTAEKVNECVKLVLEQEPVNLQQPLTTNPQVAEVNALLNTVIDPAMYAVLLDKKDELETNQAENK